MLTESQRDAVLDVAGWLPWCLDEVAADLDHYYHAAPPAAAETLARRVRWLPIRGGAVTATLTRARDAASTRAPRQAPPPSTAAASRRGGGASGGRLDATPPQWTPATTTAVGGGHVVVDAEGGDYLAARLAERGR